MSEQPHRVTKWAVPASLLALAGLCVVGAFLGVERSPGLFTSLPMAAFWVWLLALLLLRLWRVKSLRLDVFAAHVGCVFIIVGAMWGSEAGHRLQERLFGVRKIPHGFMAIGQGVSEDRVADQSLSCDLGRLPFQVKLERFRIQHYAGSDGPLMARAYQSRVVIVENGQERCRGVIEVNRPLHYGGYHLYQHAYDVAALQYTILGVVSDSGLATVYVGFGLLFGGVLWGFWVRPVCARVRGVRRGG